MPQQESTMTRETFSASIAAIAAEIVRLAYEAWADGKV